MKHKYTVTEELRNLAERCEHAQQPNTQLDFEIWRLCIDLPGDGHVPHYTSSMDAAFVLVEDIKDIMMAKYPDIDGREWLVRAGDEMCRARSWPLAMCGMGLRMRAKTW